MSLTLIITTPTNPRQTQPINLGGEQGRIEAARLRSALNRWANPMWQIRDTDGEVITTVDLRQVVAVEFTDATPLATDALPECGKSAAAGDG